MATSSDSSKNRDEYILGRDLLASSRLRLQHYLWTSTLGFLLHPSIPLAPSSTLAEIACGTGDLSLQIAPSLAPNSSIHAYDLSLAQTPPKAWTPSNVSFHALDIFSEIPASIQGSYDIVFIRHFICVIQSGDPRPLLTRLLSLLKPGGYLQWQEWDLSTLTLYTAPPNTPAPATQALKAFGAATIGEQTQWTAEFHTLLAKHKEVEFVAHERHRCRPDMRPLAAEIQFMGGKESAASARAREGEGSAMAAKLEKVFGEAEDEYLALGKAALYESEMVTWVVRKK